MESCCFLFGYVTFDRLLIWSTSSLGICISQLVVWIVNKRGNLCICRAFIPFDHHLTTPSSQPVPFIVFYVPTFFYNHHKQRRKLCTLHNFRRCIIVFTCQMSQFSDPKGRRFESCQPHQKSTRLRYVGACFCCCMELAAARAALQPHHLPQLLLCLPLFLVKGMGINVQRRTGLGVAQQTGYRAHVHALGDQ